MATPITLLCVGRLKSKHRYLQTGIDYYIKLLTPFTDVSIVEVPDAPLTASHTTAQVQAQEAQRLEKHLATASWVVALSEHATPLDSPAFAQQLQQWVTAAHHNMSKTQPNKGSQSKGHGPIMMVVGGASGLSPQVIKHADTVLSLSPLTFPHLMVRLILLEQLYRGFTLLHHRPYHK